MCICDFASSSSVGCTRLFQSIFFLQVTSDSNVQEFAYFVAKFADVHYITRVQYSIFNSCTRTFFLFSVDHFFSHLFCFLLIFSIEYYSTNGVLFFLA